MVSFMSDAVMNASHNSISVCRDLAPLRSERMHSLEPSKTVFCSLMPALVSVGVTTCHKYISWPFPSSELKALVLSHNQLSTLPGVHVLTELNSLG